MLRSNELLTLCAFLGFVALLTLRVFITTGRSSRVALYTSEEPPESNGVASHLSGVCASVNEEGRMSKIPHSFRRCFMYCFRLRLAKFPFSRACAWSGPLRYCSKTDAPNQSYLQAPVPSLLPDCPEFRPYLRPRKQRGPAPCV